MRPRLGPHDRGGQGRGVRRAADLEAGQVRPQPPTTAQDLIRPGRAARRPGDRADRPAHQRRPRHGSTQQDRGRPRPTPTRPRRRSRPRSRTCWPERLPRRRVGPAVRLRDPRRRPRSTTTTRTTRRACSPARLRWCARTRPRSSGNWPGGCSGGETGAGDGRRPRTSGASPRPGAAGGRRGTCPHAGQPAVRRAAGIQGRDHRRGWRNVEPILDTETFERRAGQAGRPQAGPPGDRPVPAVGGARAAATRRAPGAARWPGITRTGGKRAYICAPANGGCGQSVLADPGRGDGAGRGAGRPG